MGEKIIDEFSDLKVSRQRKWALRHPDKLKELQRLDNGSEKARERKRKWYLAQRSSKRLKE